MNNMKLQTYYMLMLSTYKFQTLTFIRTYYKAIPKTKESLEFTKSFLKNRCGLTGKNLGSASNKVNLQSTDERPELVLQLFEKYKFSETNITRIITSDPRVLRYCPHNCLQPKFDFLLSVTHSESEMAGIVAKNPQLLTRSLSNHVIPLFDLLKSVTGSDQNAVATVKSNPFMLTYCVTASLLQNVEFLQKLGVPQTQILKLLTKYGQSIGQNHGTFRKVVLKVKEMGFDLSSSHFISAVQSVHFVSDLAWAYKCEICKVFGFSDDDIFTTFKKRPDFMRCSDKRIRETLEFFVYKLNWSPSRLSTSPNVMQYSLEKRIIPRCSVLKLLVPNKCYNKRFMLTSILAMSEKEFLETFVTAYKDEVPEVVCAHQGKLRFDEYNLE